METEFQALVSLETVIEVYIISISHTSPYYRIMKRNDSESMGTTDCSSRRDFLTVQYEDNTVALFEKLGMVEILYGSAN